MKKTYVAPAVITADVVSQTLNGSQNVTESGSIGRLAGGSVGFFL